MAQTSAGTPTIGEVIRAWRVFQGLRLIDLAEKAAVPKGYVSALEHDRKTHPWRDNLKKLAAALGISLQDIDDRRMPPAKAAGKAHQTAAQGPLSGMAQAPQPQALPVGAVLQQVLEQIQVLKAKMEEVEATVGTVLLQVLEQMQIPANAQLYAEMQDARERLQGLSHQLLEAQEAKRRRIAHELHDEAGQLLVFAQLALEAAVSGLPQPFQERFHPIRGHLEAIEAQLRRLSHGLRPTVLDDLGLLPALQFLADGVAARTGLRIHVDSAIAGRLPPAVETALYWIMREGLTNVTKHARATHVRLQLRRAARTVQALLHDDGVGFAVDPVVNQRDAPGLGLLGIRERVEVLGGTLQITSAPGQGTTLQIALPVDPEEASSEADGAWADASLPGAQRNRVKAGA